MRLKRFAHGSLLAEKQGIQWMIADSTMELYQCKLMVLHAAYKIDRKEDFKSEVSMAKHFVANCAQPDRRPGDPGPRCARLLERTRRWPRWLTQARWARFADGADEVHQWRIAQRAIEAYSKDGSVRKAAGDLPL